MSPRSTKAVRLCEEFLRFGGRASGNQLLQGKDIIGTPLFVFQVKGEIPPATRHPESPSLTHFTPMVVVDSAQNSGTPAALEKYKLLDLPGHLQES